MIVYKTGWSQINIPPQMGIPRADQLQGTPLENLCEAAGRACYDSLGKPNSRSSPEYHKHIQEVRHLSVYRHAVVNIRMKYDIEKFLNRKGVTHHFWGISINAQAALEWGAALDPRIATAFYLKMPQVFPPAWADGWSYYDRPPYESATYVSLFLEGSRGWSHEQVRHQFAVSQESTRYVDASKSKWVLHPATKEVLGDDPKLEARVRNLIAESQATYSELAKTIEARLQARGVPKQTARKQARGAARGVLGNALETAMVFTASLSDWKGMMNQRLTDAADAEIRNIFEQHVLPLFPGTETKPAEDGFGRVLA